MSNVPTYLARHAQALIAALGRLLRRPLGSLLTVLVIAIALALPTVFWMLFKNIGVAAGGITQSIELSVYFKTEVPLEKAQQLAAATKSRSGVAEVVVIPADQGLAEFREYSGFGDALDALEDNPLPHVLTVRPKASQAEPQAIESLRRQLAAWPEVDSVQVDGEWVRRLDALLALLREAFAVLAVLLGTGVLVLVGNAIRLEIVARRAEIEVTKLVGGSDAFVRRPFLYTGLFFGLFGGTVALVVVASVMAAIAGPVERLAMLYGGSFVLTGVTATEGLVLIGGAAVLGLLGAWLGAARLIARIEPRD